MTVPEGNPPDSTTLVGKVPTLVSTSRASASAPPSPRVGGGPRTSRTDLAACRLAALAQAALPGDRLGSKEELRLHCGVSMGTFNEAIRLLQARGLVNLRPGPGGGLFAAVPSPMVRLGNSVLALDADQTSVADAVRIRDALDPLMIEDALWHASPATIAPMRAALAQMGHAARTEDAVGFVRANWLLHACIADVSPNVMLRSLYTSLLDVIETHTMSVLPVQEQPLAEYIALRHQLHEDLVDAIADRDRDRAMELIRQHATGDTVTLRPSSSTT
jgi:DNA-binding FadR family transcriptional regulator